MTSPYLIGKRWTPRSCGVVQGALECLLTATGAAIETSTTAAAAPPAPYHLTCAAVTSDSSNLQLLLEVLEVEESVCKDFYVRYSMIQLLGQLVAADNGAMQAAVLARPQVRPRPPPSAAASFPNGSVFSWLISNCGSSQGVVRLMDLLADVEAIRNAALLLLIRLTHCQEEIQKIVAYRDAFDTLFSIISDEGFAAGGVLVQVHPLTAMRVYAI